MKRLPVMKTLVSLAAMLLFACAPSEDPKPEVPAEPSFDRATEEAALDAVHDAFYTDYNNHDVEKIAASFHDDTLILFDSVVTGRDVIQTEYEAIFEKNEGIHIERPEELPTIFLTPNVAIKRGRRLVTAAEGAEHADEPHAIVAIVFVKKDGEWRRAAIFEGHEE